MKSKLVVLLCFLLIALVVMPGSFSAWRQDIGIEGKIEVIKKDKDKTTGENPDTTDTKEIPDTNDIPDSNDSLDTKDIPDTKDISDTNDTEIKVIPDIKVTPDNTDSGIDKADETTEDEVTL